MRLLLENINQTKTHNKNNSNGRKAFNQILLYKEDMSKPSVDSFHNSNIKFINDKNRIEDLKLNNINIYKRGGVVLEKDLRDNLGQIYEEKNLTNYCIITLDKNGSVNMYKDEENKIIFNLYEINDISEQYKKKEFFNVGFPYYIVMNELYFGITTDHGLFVINNNEFE